MSWKKALFLGTPLLMNPFTDSFLVPTNLSPITNSESKRYHYPVCPAQAEILMVHMILHLKPIFSNTE